MCDLLSDCRAPLLQPAWQVFMEAQHPRVTPLVSGTWSHIYLSHPSPCPWGSCSIVYVICPQPHNPTQKTKHGSLIWIKDLIAWQNCMLHDAPPPRLTGLNLKSVPAPVTNSSDRPAERVSTAGEEVCERGDCACCTCLWQEWWSEFTSGHNRTCLLSPSSDEVYL